MVGPPKVGTRTASHFKPKLDIKLSISQKLLISFLFSPTISLII